MNFVITFSKQMLAKEAPKHARIKVWANDINNQAPNLHYRTSLHPLRRCKAENPA
jgi:hypothetical protein